MAIVAVSISPIGEGVSVSRFVARALRELEEETDLIYETGPMFTTIEGTPDEVFAAVRRMQEAMFAEGAQRVTTVLKMDDRRDAEHGMHQKMESLQQKLE